MRSDDFRRGDVWMADLEPTLGEEIRKTRPVVILSEDSIGKLRLRIVVPVTDWSDRFAHYPWMVRLDPDAGNGLTKVSAGDAFQVRSISAVRLKRRMGSVPASMVDALAAAVALCIGYRPPTPAD